MKAISAMIISLTITASRALAAGGAYEGGRSGFLTECLIALLVMVVLFQFVPGFTLLVDSVKKMFASDNEKAQVTTASEKVQ